jgi:uncharacterized protein
MNLKCIIGIHDWSEDCEHCAKCGKFKNPTDEGHDWTSDCEKCAICGKSSHNHRHTWSGCKCSICGKTRDDEHKYNGNVCSVCGKMEHWGNILHRAAYDGDLKQLHTALAAGVSVNEASNEASAADSRWPGFTALHFAAGRGQLEAVKMLCDAGADINSAAAQMGGYTPLHVAVNTLVDSPMPSKRMAVVRYLVKRGVDVNAQLNGRQFAGQFGRTPAYEAAARSPSDWDLVLFLAKHGAHLNVKPHEERSTILGIAIGQGSDTRIVQKLLEYGADVNHAFDLALQFQRPDLVRITVELGADANGRRGITTQPLHSLAYYSMGDTDGGPDGWGDDMLEIARYLLSKGVDINAEDGDGRSALNLAVDKRCLTLVRFLLANGAKVNARAERSVESGIYSGFEVGIWRQIGDCLKQNS